MSAYAQVCYAPPDRVEIERHIAQCQRAAGGSGCQSWCRYHDGEVCFSPERGPWAENAPVVVTFDPVFGVLVSTAAREAVTPVEALRFAEQIRAAVEAAGNGGAP